MMGSMEIIAKFDEISKRGLDLGVDPLDVGIISQK